MAVVVFEYLLEGGEGVRVELVQSQGKQRRGRGRGYLMQGDVHVV